MNDKPRILIVDGDYSTRQTLGHVFEARSYEVELAGTGQEALQMVPEQPFNLALLDARLPDMDGIELLASLQRMHPDLAVIIVTAYASLNTAIRALNEGASSYIMKPLNIDRMLATVRDVLEKQRLALENRKLYEEMRQELARRREAEVALGERKKWFQSIFELAADYILILDATYEGEPVIVDANQAACRMHGYKREEMVGRPISFLDDEESRKGIRERVRLLKTSKVLVGEVAHVRKDGSKIYAEINSRLVHIGERDYIISIERDITRRKAEEARQARLRSILAATNQVKRLVIHEGNTPAMLQGACRALLQNKVADAVWVGLLDEASETVRAVALEGTAAGNVQIRFSLRDSDSTCHCVRTALHEGRPFLVEDVRESPPCATCIVRAQLPHESTLAVPLLYQDQHYGALVISSARPWVFGEDGTNLLVELAGDLALGLRSSEAEAAHRKSEAKYRDLVETSHDLVWRCDAEGRFTFLNPAWEKTHGYAVEEMLGRPFTDFQTPEVAARDTQEFGRHLAGRSVTGYETTHIAKSGEVIHLLFYAIPLYDVDGNIVGTQGTAHDITERIRREQALQQYVRRLKILRDIDHAILSAQSPEAIAQAAMQHIRQLVPCQRASVTTFDAETCQTTVLAIDHSSKTQFPQSVQFPLSQDRIDSLRQGREYLVPDIQALPDLSPVEQAMLAEGLRSCVSVPLMVRGALIGSLNLGAEMPNAFAPEHLEIACEVADSLATAIQQARTSEEMCRHAEELRLAGDILRSLNATPQIRDAFQEVATGLKAITGGDRVSLVLLDKNLEWFTIFALDKPRPELAQDEWVRIPETPAAKDVLAGRPHLTPDLAAESDYPVEQRLYQAGHRSRINLPLRAGGRVIGALNITWPRPAGYDEGQLPLLEQIAGAVALALERSRLFDQVRIGSEQLRQLAGQVVSAQEEERQRLSRELHDEAGQALVALKMSLQSLLVDVPAELEAPRVQLREAVALTDTTMERIRLLAHDLRPPALDTAGLNATLEGFCREFAGQTQLAIVYDGAEFPELTDAVDICLYRVLQGALTNVARHAQANHVRVALAREANTIRLSVEDDGQGFDRQARTSAPTYGQGIGLLGMEERLRLLGGWLDLESKSGEGTRLAAYIPWEEAT